MLPRENRLRKKKEFDRVFKEGNSFKNDLFLIKVADNELDTSRFGFVVSKKVSKKAVRRNKIKRWLRESTRPLLKDMKRNVDCTVISFPSINDSSFQEIQEHLITTLKKAELL